ncbi:RluA family pseudouridine synthase [Betaproteobacteria bacterium]|nr:RluA family pseudouridine synthase [Betaproteobacteria bacterium]
MLLNVDPDSNGQRLDNFLVKMIKNIPKSRIYRMVRTGEVRINSRRVKVFAKVYQGDSVRIPPLSGMTIGSSQVESTHDDHIERLAHKNISIVFEDECMIILDKPSGISVHGVKEKRLGLLELTQTVRRDTCLKLCHRLDKDTSGLLIVSKKRSFLLNLQKQLKNGEVNKRYLAICLLNSNSTEIPKEVCKPLLRTYDHDGNRLVTISKKGKYALTKLREIKRILHRDFGFISLIECIPTTGRTHQIRVHLSSLGVPILGDKKYGEQVLNKTRAERMFLHAWKLSFRKPGMDKKLRYESPIPVAFKKVLKSIE